MMNPNMAARGDYRKYAALTAYILEVVLDLDNRDLAFLIVRGAAV
jgi:hypothetical protein